MKNVYKVTLGSFDELGNRINNDTGYIVLAEDLNEAQEKALNDESASKDSYAESIVLLHALDIE